MGKEWIQVPPVEKNADQDLRNNDIQQRIARSILKTTGTGITFVIAETRAMKIKAACGRGRAPD
jgi:hypothetical protein